ncbi:MAG TPA: N-acetylmuramic acid 6-phosphate etherase [Bacilli bacterium]|jgi:N-acetylmuramic acid 6-phosphate etherase|nr:N-acetylmuramic acid 6-phosphate etherase [Acholeplasmataceae bacterium]HNZ78291.1 N-acetylmuramic acid 6-phosphate etherase [Bacilli bacterium]HOD61735.1 N-acetylmuramic acid 6-phosphate etherase [Bacilli bacterium]HOH62281.1 N-acetylmuramic acid 6-phosphate etherase [Bacilli bacterium]HPB49538.1 N-acetylmuramic acid 6-phosphate etherase [Bacilli bacterium]
MGVNLNEISTEQRNLETTNIDLLSTIEILKKMNQEDYKIAHAVELALPQIAKLVDKVVKAFYQDGRLIYMGAGTSGRIGILDAVECPPTFGVSFEMVQCLMAGGEKAFIKAVEGAEDSKELAISDLQRIKISKKDVVVGIAASGRTPYVIGGIEYAKKQGCITSCIVTAANSQLAALVDLPIEAITGEEVIAGSTRLKSGTAQKMICNMISTASMIKMGKVYENYMIDVQATNQKLIARAEGMVSQITGISLEEARKKMAVYKTAKKTIFAILSGIEDLETVNEYLDKTKGHIRNALRMVKKDVETY